MRKSLMILGIGILTLVLGIGLVAYQSASAAVDNQTDPEESGALFLGDPGGRGGTTRQDLADALGISQEELDAAIAQAKSDILAQAVEDGLLTQAQADELAESGRSSMPGGRWAGWLKKNGLEYKPFLASALDISEDELDDAILQARYTAIDRAVDEGILTEERASLMKARLALVHDDTFVSSMQSAYEEAIQQAVADGVITQEQADAILENGMNGVGPQGWGEMGGERGPHEHGFGGWFDQGPEAEETMEDPDA